MKKLLLILSMTVMSFASVWSQCVPTCSAYGVSQVNFTTFPIGVNNAVPQFAPNTDDGYTPPISLGFNFNYYCTSYNSVLIYTNGLIQFNIGAPSTFPNGYDAAQLIPNPSIPTILNGIVCFRMDDLDPTVGGTVTYGTTGVSPNQMFVVTYSNVPQFGNSTILYSGQIVLYESSNTIDIYTISAPQGPNLATQGIEDPTGTLATASPGLNQSFWSLTNTGYRFSPYTPAPPTSITGPTTVCQGDQGFYQSNFIPTASSINWYLPAGWQGTSTISAITATAGVTGNLSVSATYTCGTSAPFGIPVTVVPAPVVSITSATPSIFCSGKTVTINTSGAVSYTLDPVGINGTPPFTDVPSTTTTYSLSGTNAAGCVSHNLSTVLITVKETPTVAVNGGSVCIGESFTLTPIGANTYAYSSTFPFVTPTLGVNSYSVVGTGTNGCVSAPAVSTVIAAPLPIITPVATRTAICIKESTSLTVSGATSYTWGNSSTSTVITVSPHTTSVFVVVGTDANGCSNTGTVSLKVNTCTGLGGF